MNAAKAKKELLLLLWERFENRSPLMLGFGRGRERIYNTAGADLGTNSLGQPWVTSDYQLGDSPGSCSFVKG